eukprot:15442689-Alexandrium_andersonii.AAC.1
MGVSSPPRIPDGTSSGTGSSSALAGASRHPKGRKKSEMSLEIVVRDGRDCRANSSVSADAGAGHGQK